MLHKPSEPFFTVNGISNFFPSGAFSDGGARASGSYIASEKVATPQPGPVVLLLLGLTGLPLLRNRTSQTD
jgi:hypothetical protein